jgi:hypothetical protein
VLLLAGRADPTGRGRGFAYTREDPKKAKEEAAPPPGVKAMGDGTITGGGVRLRVIVLVLVGGWSTVDFLLNRQ